MQSLRFTRDRLEGVALHAVTRGDPANPCVILLHGGGANLHWWDEIAPTLARRFHVVSLDFRGHGDSDYPEDRQVGAFHRDLEALIEHLGREDVALVGHSMGGHIALDHAARHPAVWGLVAVEVAFGSARRDRRRTRLALHLRRTYPSREDAVSRYRPMPRSPGLSEARRLRLAEHSIAELPEGGFAYKFDPGWFGLPPAPHARVADVHCPTLLIRGDQSSLFTEAGIDSLMKKLPQATRLDVPGAGHNVHIERPEIVARAVLEHLSAIRPGVD